MKILVLEGSPHKHGSSNLLADQFIQGSKDAGHEVTTFDVGNANIHPCMGCDACGMAGNCVYKDDMYKVKDLILSSDMLVFVTPIYYFGMSAQLKAVIDRFYSFTTELSSKYMKTVLITAAWDSDMDAVAYLRDHYKKICLYMNFQDKGMVLGTGCCNVSMTRSSKHMEKAYQLGKTWSISEIYKNT